MPHPFTFRVEHALFRPSFPASRPDCLRLPAVCCRYRRRRTLHRYPAHRYRGRTVRHQRTQRLHQLRRSRRYPQRPAHQRNAANRRYAQHPKKQKLRYKRFEFHPRRQRRHRRCLRYAWREHNAARFQRRCQRHLPRRRARKRPGAPQHCQHRARGNPERPVFRALRPH